MNFYARVSLCRTVNRSLDYVSCLSRIRKYGFGEKDLASTTLDRCLKLAGHFFDLIYYPAECIAWLYEANVFGPNRSSRPFRLTSTLCWLANILISVVTNTLKLIQYRRLLKLQSKSKKSSESVSTLVDLSDMYKCMLTLLSNLCFFINCIQWLAIPGLLWSGKLPVFVVGLCGTIASLTNVVKLMI